MASTPSMGAMGCRSTATMRTPASGSSLCGRYSRRLSTWLQLPGAAQRSTALRTPALTHHVGVM